MILYTYIRTCVSRTYFVRPPYFWLKWTKKIADYIMCFFNAVQVITQIYLWLFQTLARCFLSQTTMVLYIPFPTKAKLAGSNEQRKKQIALCVVLNAIQVIPQNSCYRFEHKTNPDVSWHKQSCVPWWDQDMTCL